MARQKIAYAVVILIATFLLVWIVMPTIHAVVPLWVVVDALVAQIVFVAALSGKS